jgi:hypothetical protein
MSTPPDDGSDLRRLFHDAVSDVHPTGGTHLVRSRARRPSPGRWLPLAVAAAVATVAVIGGAAWLGRQGESLPSAGGGGGTSHHTAAQGTAPEATERRTVRVPVYYAGRTAAGVRLFTETHTVEHLTGSNLDAAVGQALESPALDHDYDVWVPTEGLVAGTTSGGTSLTVDLTAPLPRPAGMDEATAQTVLQAVVWTADATTSSELPVRFTVRGSPAAQVLGIDTHDPVQRGSADSVLSSVSISGPLEGATVPTRFQVTGRASAFEANVVWELQQGDRVVRHGFTTATECCTLSPYSFTVSAPPGDYTLVVHDTDESGGEGVGTSADTKHVTVK